MEIQEQAIKHENGHALLLAGPGTGKTKSITEHIRFLIKEKQVDQKKILALTFTIAAAKEMRERLQQLGLSEEEIPEVRTLHSYCFQKLRKATRTEFVGTIVLDKWEEKNIFYKDLAIMTKQLPNVLMELVEGHDASWAMLTTPPPPHKRSAIEIKIKELRRIYGYARQGELVYQFKKYLDSDPSFNPNLEHILVDEYQDLNACDLYVIKTLSDRNKSMVYAAGDDDQCIYKFRHADPRGIRSFTSKYAGAQQYILEKCYRCAKSILTAATTLMTFEPERIRKVLNATHSQDGQVKIISTTSEDQQWSTVAEIILRHKEAGVREKDILVLVPRRDFAQQYVEAIENLGVNAANLTKSHDVLMNNEQRKLIYALRFNKNEYKNLATRAWLECTAGIGHKKISELIEKCLENDSQFYDECKLSGNDRIKSVVLELEQTATDMQDPQRRNELVSKAAFSNLGLELIEKTIKDQQSEVNLDQLPVEENAEIVTQALDVDAVRVMTMQGSKGLSATVTIITDVEEHLIPANSRDVNEQRRLLYVSITRAKQFLYITHTATRTGKTRFAGTGHSSSGGRRKRSPFLDEVGIPSSLYDPEILKFEPEQQW